jgi:hypothetical protein
MKINMVRTINTFVFGAAQTVLTSTLQENGWINVIRVDLPTFTNTVTGVVTITDRDGYVVYASGSLTMGAITAIGDSIAAAELGSVPCDLNYSMTLTLSGVPGGTGGTAKVLMYLKK